MKLLISKQVIPTFSFELIDVSDHLESIKFTRGNIRSFIHDFRNKKSREKEFWQLFQKDGY